MSARPWCCPEPRCEPIHALRGGDRPLTEPDPGESFVCFGMAPEVSFTYDGVEHVNDTRSCNYTPLKGLIAFQENVDDWDALSASYARAARSIRRRRMPSPTSPPPVQSRAAGEHVDRPGAVGSATGRSASQT